MDTTVPDVHPGFKRKIIIYKNTKPSEPEVYESIRHYCREHGKKYRKISRKNPLKYQIDGTIYSLDIRMNTPDDPSDGWMICCISS
ncbi:hypothetical protein BRYFOR_07331 [Marvinbryantia formatexigens DSM 14469]|uniref:DUF4318 domain-containing protein n=1 Tax=Marvinbryantia formatexigens DSM 14469 TaxID=478749 RepID=C6LFC9_9FIRM|nr:hypothetical protein [Marvinbryantia formatexigens]EET60514.1 hypothetical protein BRYFOR_07331 [Marvinbryantia formatexigens DSM 14469]UWO25528.1 hypothetical protein NQ534_03270 [Marvinbryantia formatexigens DSM 14469]SDG21556.1 hypothetical protein SAMN05660368_02152 [Marvinbryantia formatexigens]